MNPAHSPRFDAASLQQFGLSLLTAAGLAVDRARDVAEVPLEGDLPGDWLVDLHGIPRRIRKSFWRDRVAGFFPWAEKLKVKIPRPA